MPAVRVALAQMNPTVGDLRANSEKILSICATAAASGAQLVVFPEMALSGYPIEDLALSSDFLAASEVALGELALSLRASKLGDLRVLVGHPAFAKEPTSWAIGQNRASLLWDGEVVSSYAKHHLPNYSVFDEYRTFVPGNNLMTFEINGLRFASVICEDIWQIGGPVSQIKANDIDLTLVLNGSPFEMAKDDSRLELVRALAKREDCAVAYVNLYGGQDDLVFDGNSFAVNALGAVISRARQFTEELDLIDFENKTSLRAINEPISTLETIDQIWQALTLGLGDYVRKNGFRSCVLGLSGGIDSAVCAALAADAIGANNVYGVAMPSRYSSDHSIADAKQLATNLGVNFHIQSIEPMIENFQRELPLESLAGENLQARMRALILMGLSNRDGHLVLTTGNKTELAVGYSTIYGDSVGGFAPLKDVEKSLVWALARFRNEKAEKFGEVAPIPQSSIDKPPSAELRPNQLDQDSLPNYELLDQILRLYVEERMSIIQIGELGFDLELVNRIVSMVKSSEWKRRQGAIGPRITKLAFGRERRLPITNRFN